MNLHLIRFALLVAMVVAIVGANVAFGNGTSADGHASAACVEHGHDHGGEIVLQARRHVVAESTHAGTVNWKRILPGVLR